MHNETCNLVILTDCTAMSAHYECFLPRSSSLIRAEISIARLLTARFSSNERFRYVKKMSYVINRWREIHRKKSWILEVRICSYSQTLLKRTSEVRYIEVWLYRIRWTTTVGVTELCHYIHPGIPLSHVTGNTLTGHWWVDATFLWRERDREIPSPSVSLFISVASFCKYNIRNMFD